MGLKNSLPKLASNRDPPNLGLQLARITGVSHQHQAHTFFFNMNILYLFFSPIDLGCITQNNDETRLGIFIMILTFKKSQRLPRHPLFYVNFHGCPS
jgi:hypothetical protein